MVQQIFFGPVKENSDDSVEEEEEPEEEQEKYEISSIFEEKGEVEDDKPDYDPWLRYAKKWGMIKSSSPAVPGWGTIPNLCRECRFQ